MSVPPILERTKTALEIGKWWTIPWWRDDKYYKDGYISVAFKNTLAFLIIIAVLIIRPEGLLGKEFKERI